MWRAARERPDGSPSYKNIYILWQTPGRSEGSSRPGNQLAPPPGHITIPPDNEAGLKAIKLECLLLKRGAGYHKPELGLGLASCGSPGSSVWLRE